MKGKQRKIADFCKKVEVFLQVECKRCNNTQRVDGANSKWGWSELLIDTGWRLGGKRVDKETGEIFESEPLCPTCVEYLTGKIVPDFKLAEDPPPEEEDEGPEMIFGYPVVRVELPAGEAPLSVVVGDWSDVAEVKTPEKAGKNGKNRVK